jgi:hypothetical protein
MDIELLKAVVEQIKEDADNKDFTAIECLFQFLDKPEKRLKGFLTEEV